MNKRILYFMDYPSNIGGANKVLLTQANIMQQKGYQVLVVIPNDSNGIHAREYDQICKEYKLKNVTAYYPIATCIEQIAIIDVIECYSAIKRLIEKFNPDLIHSTQLNITVELAARELQIPHLMNIYQIDESEFLVDWLNVYPQYHSADTILFSERWGQGLGIPSRCIRVAYAEKGDLQKKCCAEKKDLLRIISIGTLCERKNQIEIVKFVLLCKEKGIRLHITFLGKNDEEYGERCKQFIDENSLWDDVTFEGFVLNIEEYIWKADLFILASKVESYPGVLVESMANRLPIISTPVAGVPELLKDEMNGFLTEGYGADDIYAAFLRYQQCKKQGRDVQIIENAYNTYLQYHTYLEVGQQLENYYQWIMNDYNKQRKNLLRVEEIKQIFDEYITEKNLDKSEEMRRSIWFLYHVFSVLEKKDNKKVAIWGAGVWGSIFLNWICCLQSDELEFVGFIDTKKQGEYLGYPIIDIETDIIEKCGTIFVAIARLEDRLEIMNYLDKQGKVKNKDYFMAFNSPVKI